jgi:hypothetical protein
MVAAREREVLRREGDRDSPAAESALVVVVFAIATAAAPAQSLPSSTTVAKSEKVAIT